MEIARKEKDLRGRTFMMGKYLRCFGFSHVILREGQRGGAGGLTISFTLLPRAGEGKPNSHRPLKRVSGIRSRLCYQNSKITDHPDLHLRDVDLHLVAPDVAKRLIVVAKSGSPP